MSTGIGKANQYKNPEVRGKAFPRESPREEYSIEMM